MSAPAGATAPATSGEKLKTMPKPNSEEVARPAPATIIVSLPAEAKLLIEGAATTSTSATRVFASPTLEPGKEYYYTLTGELLREGQVVTTTQRVTIRAGEQSRVQLTFPVGSVAKN